MFPIDPQQSVKRVFSVYSGIVMLCLGCNVILYFQFSIFCRADPADGQSVGGREAVWIKGIYIYEKSFPQR